MQEPAIILLPLSERLVTANSSRSQFYHPNFCYRPLTAVLIYWVVSTIATSNQGNRRILIERTDNLGRRNLR